MKIKLNKIPSVFKNVSLPEEVTVSSHIPAEEGAMVMVEAGGHEGKKNILDFAGGRLGWLWKWDQIPAVLGYRKAPVEFAGEVPGSVSVGDKLYLLCESGVVGEISGVFEAWGRPMKVKVLGSIVGSGGKPMNLKNYALPLPAKVKKSVPLILFLGTRMDSGKTAMACKISHELKAMGKKVAAVKLTGVAFTQDIMKLSDSGASPVYDFVDMGLPSTCNGNTFEIVSSALNLIDLAQAAHPDFILVEFGDGVLGEYHVADILQNEKFSSQIGKIILAANDFAGIAGTRDILEAWNMKIDLVTGPIANSKIGVDLIHKYFRLAAESNQHNIPRTLDIILGKKSVFTLSDWKERM